MSGNLWLFELEEMCFRYSELGVLHDLVNMNNDEKWGLYRYLKGYEITHGTD